MMVTWRARVRRLMEEISHKIYECHFLAISWNMNYWNHKNAERRGSGQNVDDRFWQEDVHSTVIGVVWQQHHLWTTLPPSDCCSLLPHHNRCSTWTLVLRSRCMLATVRLVWNLLLFSWQKIRPSHAHQASKSVYMHPTEREVSAADEDTQANNTRLATPKVSFCFIFHALSRHICEIKRVDIWTWSLSFNAGVYGFSSLPQVVQQDTLSFLRWFKCTLTSNLCKNHITEWLL